MAKDYPGEQWKNIRFNLEFPYESRLEISNFGRLRSFNKISNGNIINGSTVNSYAIIRLKFFKPMDKKSQKELNQLRLKIITLSKELKLSTDKKTTESLAKELSDLKISVAKKARAEEKKRTIYYQSLIHRLVATYFLKAPSAGKTIVAHYDYNKLNNRAHNLEWMTPEENYAHQKKSPYVIAEKEERIYKRKSGTTKLSITKVMLLKKLLNQNKPIKQLVKQFRVTDTQIIRIKKGENWGYVKAAE